jgi:hypothetical protein
MPIETAVHTVLEIKLQASTMDQYTKLLVQNVFCKPFVKKYVEQRMRRFGLDWLLESCVCLHS